MAHEIAHVAARHGTRQATRGELVNYASLPLIFMGGWTGYALYQGAGAIVPLGFLRFSRAFESEADVLGLQYVRHPEQKDDSRPSLHRRPGDGGTADTDADGNPTKPDQDDRPTLKRRN